MPVGVGSVTRQTQSTIGDAVTAFFGAPFRADTYRRLAYLLVAFPLGLAGFVAVTVGGSVGAGLAITWVGIPILVATLLLATALAGVQAQLNRTLLGRSAAVPEVLVAGRREDERFRDTLARFLTTPTTWTSVLLVGVTFVFGIVAFVATVTAGAVTAALLSAPFVYDDPAVVYRFVDVSVDTLPEALAVCGLGVLSVFVAVNALNLLAEVGGLVTEALLTVGTVDDE